ncbi:STAS domain-containing protein [candidate division KSB1 bacterium]|nr:STAS domain-containing protein [candidate division KSB1 bacterium]NIR70799.1 STAS domain-containing protein [candidate division KSB1 bacterium]NIS27812.1 STAS domain-containing protein [candidate division KSB1 bacterium]NIT74694.1 STAS domain-containing protein [candidate division KSB1 bacterium]NIU28479.1 STAS domain-containing protein [candidate division KSB1 bacterium]
MKVNVLSEDSIKRVVFESGVEGRSDVDVDLESSPKLRNKLVELTDDQEQAILVDLANVKYMDSSGIATLVEALQKVGKYGGKLKIANLRQAVRDVFELSRLDKVFEIYPTIEEAKDSF